MTRHPVIALVGSAGSLDAVFAVLGGLEPDLTAAVIVLIHQSPDRASALADLLGRRTRLPVAEAEHGAPLTPGSVLVAPPGKHVLVTPQEHIALIVSGAAPPSRPSADLLLTTMATALGDRAVGVVLSGGGHDGATGATAVHDLGGTVWATDEASSSVFAMPRATIQRDGVIDRVLPVGDVAAALAGLCAPV